jgi:hypothetical protein
VLAGGLLGLLVGGVGSRLSMMLLAALNAEAAGRISDDGFRIGQMTASGTMNLLFVCTLLGVLGGAIYDVLRPLLIGPRWFRIASISVGPAVAVGSLLVHQDGVDFRILHPVWLGIALFVAIPGVYAALLTIVAEAWLQPGAWPTRVRAPLAYAPLALWGPVAPMGAIFAAGWVIVRAVRRSPLESVIDHPATPWVFRGALTLVFTVALSGLVRDTIALV